MFAIGFFSSKRVSTGDDYAVARRSYGPVVLALAFAATTASGATFLGIPGLAYSHGVPALWYPFLYPLGTYIGVFLCISAVSKTGNQMGSRSIPEYLGDRFNSEFLRLAFAIFSLMLVFYLAAQLVAGLVMFEQLLSMTRMQGLVLTTVVLLVYVLLGGAHADIITDAVQGIAMLLIAVLVIFLFTRGVLIDGERVSTLSVLKNADPGMVAILKPSNPMFGSWPVLVLMLIAHIPLGLLPHIGNKFWALKDGKDRRRFFCIAFAFALILPFMALGGLLSRATLGEDLLQPGVSPNEAVPALFIEIFPAWFAALISVAILSAVMSTTDGLVVAASQVFANDIYRRSLARRIHANHSKEQIESNVLMISRIATAGILIGSALLAWVLRNGNIALVLWIGVGGMNAALAGPMILGSRLEFITKQGAIAGMFSGAISFILLHTGILSKLLGLAPDAWLTVQAPNPFTCTGLGIIISIIFTVVVSLLSRKGKKQTERQQ